MYKISFIVKRNIFVSQRYITRRYATLILENILKCKISDPPDRVKKQFLTLAMQLHPDKSKVKNSKVNLKFAELNHANKILSNYNKKEELKKLSDKQIVDFNKTWLQEYGSLYTNNERSKYLAHGEGKETEKSYSQTYSQTQPTDFWDSIYKNQNHTQNDYWNSFDDVMKQNNNTTYTNSNPSNTQNNQNNKINQNNAEAGVIAYFIGIFVLLPIFIVSAYS